jgi:D-glycero-alpha-D-manno-heptose-7-phosphate kinase
MSAAGKNGALAAKVCGAGGGGCVLFLADPAQRDRVVRAVQAAGGRVLDARLARRGLRVKSE